MKKIYLFLYLFSIISISCQKEKKIDNTSSSEEIMRQKEEKQDSLMAVNSNLDFDSSIDKKTLKKWQQKVREDADEYYYNQLAFYYSENPLLIDEMIEYSEIMIDKKQRNDVYIIDYYDYIKNSTSQQKHKQMNKAIKYLKELLKRSESYTAFQSKIRLSELYREGIYVKKDSIIADYLNAGGNNSDSIVQARKNN